jgi:hypothetical protein
MFLGLFYLLLAAGSLVATGYFTYAATQGAPMAGAVFLAGFSWLIAAWLNWKISDGLEDAFPASCGSCGSYNSVPAVGASALAAAAQYAFTGSVGADAAHFKCGDCGEWWRGNRGCVGGTLVTTSGCLFQVAMIAILPVGAVVVFVGMFAIS